jgi:hypothetical protein
VVTRSGVGDRNADRKALPQHTHTPSLSLPYSSAIASSGLCCIPPLPVFPPSQFSSSRPPASCYPKVVKRKKRGGRTCSKGQDLLCSTVDETPRPIHQLPSAAPLFRARELRAQTNKQRGGRRGGLPPPLSLLAVAALHAASFFAKDGMPYAHRYSSIFFP